ncbi:MAG: hypothetical protein U0N77_02945 [Turicibacter sanguinis]|uniref:hypothetical protein n=1 Tax=Turicibacter sanguinis TaxID=154288 RepID=UPI002F91E078
MSYNKLCIKNILISLDELTLQTKGIDFETFSSHNPKYDRKTLIHHLNGLYSEELIHKPFYAEGTIKHLSTLTKSGYSLLNEIRTLPTSEQIRVVFDELDIYL